MSFDSSPIPGSSPTPSHAGPRPPHAHALLEYLIREGPLTATQAGALLGSPASCSFHLRQLAKYGFVEEADGGTAGKRPGAGSA
jgi:predicted ArsR family transcriptional regulator